MLITLDDLIEEFQKQNLIIVNTNDMSGKILYYIISKSLKDKKVLSYYSGFLLDSRYIEKILNEKEAILISIYFTLNSQKHVGSNIYRKYVELVNQGKVVLVSDSLSIQALESLEENGWKQYLTNKRVLKTTEKSKTYSLAETIFKVFEELEISPSEYILIQRKNGSTVKIPTNFAFVLAHYDDNPDITNPEEEHNKFLKERMESLEIKDLELNIERRLPKDLGILNNIGIALNFKPDNILSLEDAIKQAEEELKYNEKFSRKFLSPVYKGRTPREWINYLFGNLSGLRKSLEDVVEVGVDIVRRWNKDLYNIILRNSDECNKTVCRVGSWKTYYLKIFEDPMKYLQLAIMLPENSVLVISNPSYNRKTTFTIISKPYDLEVSLPTFLAMYGSPKLIKNKKRVGGIGSGDAMKGYAWVQEEDVKPLGFVLALSHIQKKKSKGTVDMQDRIIYRSLTKRRVVIGIAPRREEYLISVAVHPDFNMRAFYKAKEVEKEFGIKSKGSLEELKVEAYKLAKKFEKLGYTTQIVLPN